MSAMCQGRLDFTHVEAKHAVAFGRYNEKELVALDGRAVFPIVPSRWSDRHLQAAKRRRRFSKVVRAGKHHASSQVL